MGTLKNASANLSKLGLAAGAYESFVQVHRALNRTSNNTSNNTDVFGPQADWRPTPDMALNEAAEAFRRAAMVVNSANANLMAPGIKLNADKTVAVSNDVFWNEDMATCPRGVKVQLLGLGGVATYGTYDGKDTFWVKWQSVPRNRTGT